ncbi:ABC-type cobalamin/Fe3+-siderophores transport system ATPase subunit [Mycoplasmoides fastidiosum]|uniref:ABC-type cobalamin/Fe3+-siderophores transport system ATPase subunit n=1 Tax=Mycoplasmoides fastidiosum TaxID=92758 RepID=A0ABU0LYN0_9BACT|nr:ABC transporter ATP-binding protein [Mycoplasmoides fastidiosum]MDQ0513790.1 ABC-type cobalamin/Fe3+-siderophores transport system ATPase subunit [Mycoplasmoides fastidiosum]UUD37792.1 ABC transporter ATP-binding protein [Mycoplasmoides fastidiosum]
MKQYLQENKSLLVFTSLIFLGLIFAVVLIPLENQIHNTWLAAKNQAVNDLKYEDASNWNYDLSYLFRNSGLFLNNQFLLQRNRFATADADLLLLVVNAFNTSIPLEQNNFLATAQIDNGAGFVQSATTLNTYLQTFAFLSWSAIIIVVFLTAAIFWNLTIGFSEKNAYKIYSFLLVYFFNLGGWFISLLLWKLSNKQVKALSFDNIEKLAKYPPFLWISRFNNFFLKFNNSNDHRDEFISTKNLGFTYSHGHNLIRHLSDVFNLSIHEKKYKEKYHIYRRKKLIEFITRLFPFLIVKEKYILKNLNFKIPKGSFTTIIGPNGSGKSTLIKVLLGLERHYFGSIYWNKINLHRIKRKSFAQNVAYFPQILEIPSGSNVYDFVCFGAIPHQNLSGKISPEQEQNILNALVETNTLQFIDRNINELSGGQRQNVILATVLAQKTDTIILDEPTTYLDVNNQNLLLTLLKKLNDRGKTIIAILHDLNQAISYSDNLIILKDGEIYSQGAPRNVVNSQMVKEVFAVDANVEIINGIPQLFELKVDNNHLNKESE